MAQWVKNSPAVQEIKETQVRSLGQEDPLERDPPLEWQPTPVFLPEKSHGQRSLVTVHGVTKSGTQLSDQHFHIFFSI